MKSAVLIVALLILALCLVPVARQDTPAANEVPATQPEPGIHRGQGSGSPGFPGEGHRYGPPAGRGPAQSPGRHGQERNAAESAREEIRRDPSDRDILGLVRRYRLGGYRRIFVRNVLMHEKRRALYQIIIDNPGVDIQALSFMTGVHPGTLRYHLDQLVTLRKVAVMEVGGVLRYYENHGRFDQKQKTVLARQRYSTTSRILDLIRGCPGISRGEIAGKVGISGPSVTRWLKQFTTEGIVREVRDGRFSRYYIDGV